MQIHTEDAAARSTQSRLATQLGALAGEAERMLHRVQREGNEKFDGARDQVADRIRHVKAELEDLEAAATYRARRGVRSATRALHEHPFMAIGIAAGTGVLLGALLARR
jgi:ElaB/YqjD/DUF883 family membrane-anchored ribosome-binding protein